MRNVIVHHMVKDPDTTKIHRPMVKQVRGPAIFHTFGVDWDDLHDSVRPRTSAIVEFPDGTVENVPLYLIKFSEPLQLPSDLVDTIIDLATDSRKLMGALCADPHSAYLSTRVKESIGNLLTKSGMTLARFNDAEPLDE